MANEFSLEGTNRAYQMIKGGTELLDWFGCTPAFHDAEIISLSLNRNGISTLALHGWQMTDRLDEKKYFILEKHAVISFSMMGIFDLELAGFSRQNVIEGLDIRYGPPSPDGQQHYTPHVCENAYELTLEPCYGLAGVIRCTDLSVSFKPGKPEP